MYNLVVLKEYLTALLECVRILNDLSILVTEYTIITPALFMTNYVLVIE